MWKLQLWIWSSTLALVGWELLHPDLFLFHFIFFLWKSCLIDTFNPCSVLRVHWCLPCLDKISGVTFCLPFCLPFCTIFTILSSCYETVFWLTPLTRARCLACLVKIPRVTIPFVPETWCNNGPLEGHRRRPWGVTQLRNLLPLPKCIVDIAMMQVFCCKCVPIWKVEGVGSSAFWLRCLFTLPQNYSWSKNHYRPSSSSNSQTDQIKITTEVAKEGTGPGQGGFAVD